jgi:hypothetical protein
MLAGLALPGVARAAEPAPGALLPTLPVLPARASGPAGFVPSGWMIEQQHEADLNRDGRPDALLLLRSAPADTPPASIGAPADARPGRSPARLLVVVFGTSGGYALAASNARLIPQVDLASQEDPLADGEITVSPGGFDLRLGLVAAVGSYQTAALHYRFRYRGGCFLLIGYDRLETHRATLEAQDLSINFLTGGVLRTRGNAQTDATQVQRERLATNPRRCLQDLGSAADFNPL